MARPTAMVAIMSVTVPLVVCQQVTNIWYQKGKKYVVPRLNSNYHRDLIEKPLRTGLKPLHVSPQPPPPPSPRHLPPLLLRRHTWPRSLCILLAGSWHHTCAGPGGAARLFISI